MRVQLRRELRFNLTGFDQQPTAYAPGEQDVPGVVGEFIRANRSFGIVLDGEPEPPSVEGPPVEPTPAASADGLEEMKRADLVALARERGVSAAGKSDEIIARLRAVPSINAEPETMPEPPSVEGPPVEPTPE